MSYWNGIECYDNTELDCFRRCPRYYKYRIMLNKQKANDAATAAEFGTAVHLALELADKGNSTGDAIIEAIKYFKPFERHEDDKRTVGKLADLLAEYFQYYYTPVDPFVPLVGYLEAGFAVELDDKILYMGRLDRPGYYAERPKEIYIMDHKTTWKIANYQTKPHHQFTGYIYGGRQLIDGVVGVVANLIGVYKNKPQRLKNGSGYCKGAGPEDVFFRTSTTRTNEELEYWRIETLATIDDIKRCKERNIWPQFTFNCYVFNKECPYFQVCSLPIQAEMDILESDLYYDDEWKPYKHIAPHDAEKGEEVSGQKYVD